MFPEVFKPVNDAIQKEVSSYSAVRGLMDRLSRPRNLVGDTSAAYDKARQAIFSSDHYKQFCVSTVTGLASNGSGMGFDDGDGPIITRPHPRYFMPVLTRRETDDLPVPPARSLRRDSRCVLKFKTDADDGFFGGEHAYGSVDVAVEEPGGVIPMMADVGVVGVRAEVTAGRATVSFKIDGLFIYSTDFCVAVRDESNDNSWEHIFTITPYIPADDDDDDDNDDDEDSDNDDDDDNDDGDDNDDDESNDPPGRQPDETDIPPFCWMYKTTHRAPAESSDVETWGSVADRLNGRRPITADTVAVLLDTSFEDGSIGRTLHVNANNKILEELVAEHRSTKNRDPQELQRLWGELLNIKAHIALEAHGRLKRLCEDADRQYDCAYYDQVEVCLEGAALEFVHEGRMKASIKTDLW